MKKHLKLISIFFLSFILVYFSYAASKKYPKNVNSPQKARIFKAAYIPQSAKISRVEIEIYDDTYKDFYDVIEVEFNHQKINLVYADASGRRARKYFQVKPGKYLIKWKVSTSNRKWPRYKTYKKIIEIRDIDKFIHISIIGNQIKIS